MRIHPLLLLALLGSGCGSTIVLEGAPPGPSEPLCDDTVPEAERVELGPIASATLIGEALHVEGLVDGRHAYAIVDLASTPARLVTLREDLEGGARWVAVGAHHARLRGAQLDVLDAADPFEPRLVSSTEVGEPAGAHGALAASGADVFTCLRAAPPEDAHLVRVALDDPAAPAPPAPKHSFPCDRYGDASRADGPLWVTHDETNVAVFDLALAGESAAVSHGFAPDGIHQYGEITALQTDEQVVATTLANDAYAFLYYRDPGGVVYSSFGRGDKQLLEVVAGHALVLVPRGDVLAVVAFDLRTPPAQEAPAPPTAMEVALHGTGAALGEFAALAHDDERVIVTDDHNLFVVPLGGTTPAEPLVVARNVIAPCP